MFASILSSFVLYLVLYFVLLLLCLPFFLSSLLLLLSLFLLSSACPLGCLASDLGLVFSLCGLLLFLFPLRYIRKKKGRKVLFFASSHGVLLSRSNSCNVVKKLRCRCFGFFQFVRFILPTNTTGVGRLARSYFYPLGHNIDITNNCSSFLK